MSSWSRQSIAVKLPIAFAVVLLVLGAAMTLVSYLEMRRTVLGIASIAAGAGGGADGDRARDVGPAARSRHAAADATPDVIAYLRTRDPALADGRSTMPFVKSTSAPRSRLRTWKCGTHPARGCWPTGAPFDETAGASRARLRAGTAIARRNDRPAAARGRLCWSIPSAGASTTTASTLGYVVERRRHCQSIADPADHRRCSPA